MNNAVKEYKEKVYGCLLLPKAQKNEVFDLISQELDAFCEEVEDISYEELEESFGEPEEIAKAYIESGEFGEVSRLYKTKKKHIKIFSIIAAVIVVAGVIVMGLYFANRFSSYHYSLGNDISTVPEGESQVSSIAIVSEIEG